MFFFFHAGSPVSRWVREGGGSLVQLFLQSRQMIFSPLFTASCKKKKKNRRQTWGKLRCCTWTLCDITKSCAAKKKKSGASSSAASASLQGLVDEATTLQLRRSLQRFVSHDARLLLIAARKAAGAQSRAAPLTRRLTPRPPPSSARAACCLINNRRYGADPTPLSTSAAPD